MISEDERQARINIERRVMRTLVEDIRQKERELQGMEAARRAGARMLLSLGMSEREVAEIAGVSHVSVHNWKEQQGAK